MVSEKYFAAYPEGLPQDRFWMSNPEAGQTPATDTVSPELHPASTGDAWGQGLVEDLKSNSPQTQE